MKRILMNLAVVMLLPLLMAATCGQNNKKEMKTLVAEQRLQKDAPGLGYE